MTTTQDTQVHAGLDMELIAEYQKLTEVETVIKKRKRDIKNEIMGYMRANNLTVTQPHNNLVAVLEKRTSYGLNPFILEAMLPSNTFRNIVNKEIDLKKVKREFVNENISIQLLRAAEVSETKEAFAVRRADRGDRSNKNLPFWKVEED